MEYESGILEGFHATFVNRSDAYPIQLERGNYAAVRKPVTPQIIVDHLTGKHTIGTYALDAQNTAKWIAFDADEEDQWQQLLSLATHLESRSIPVYRELSRRGGHLWLFIPPLPGLHVRRFSRQLLTEHGIDPDSIEIYPRQVQLVEGGLGSLVRLPLGKHLKTGKVYPFVDQYLQPLARTPKEMLPLLAQPRRVPMPFIIAAIANAPQIEVPKPSPTFAKRDISHLSTAKPSEKIMAAISTYDFVRQYVELDISGHGFCPFHEDEHQSFGVNIAGDYWNCFSGCGGGTLIHFWQRWRAEHGQDGSFAETVKDLLQILGL